MMLHLFFPSSTRVSTASAKSLSLFAVLLQRRSVTASLLLLSCVLPLITKERALPLGKRCCSSAFPASCTAPAPSTSTDSPLHQHPTQTSQCCSWTPGPIYSTSAPKSFLLAVTASMVHLPLSPVPIYTVYPLCRVFLLLSTIKSSFNEPPGSLQPCPDSPQTDGPRAWYSQGRKNHCNTGSWLVLLSMQGQSISPLDLR